MPHRIANSTLNASTIDILNVIRQNASLEYQSLVPTVAQATDIPKVGEVLFGYPALANQFINALVNRIALVRVNSATFNNPYSSLKKGYLEYGESVEEIFVNIAKILAFSEEKAEGRELKRYLPDVKAAFHVINWRVLYPVTIEEEMLREAFLSLDGVTDMIARIVDTVYTAAEYDEFLLFKYLIIKSVNAGMAAPVAVDATDLKNAAIGFRGISNALTFMSPKYTPAGVMNTTPKSRQVIFMDSMFNAQFDVNILASAFNMDKADFMGRLHLIDDFTSFDNDRFAVIRAESDGLEAVTSAELSVMANVIGIIADENFFQIYDNLNKFTEKYVAAGLRWNYFYHTWKTVSASPYHNFVVFVKGNSTLVTDPTGLEYTITSMDVDAGGNIVINLGLTGTSGGGANANLNFHFVQTEDLTEAGIAVQPYGSVIIPGDTSETEIVLEVTNGSTTLEATLTLADAAAGATIDFPDSNDGGGNDGGGGTP